MKKLMTLLLILASVLPTFININITVNNRIRINNSKGDKLRKARS